MGADCPTMEAFRPAPLGIAQDADCVTWDKLVALRLLYNEIWDRLDACGLAEGSKYGDVDLSRKQEIDTLPTVEGFFRLTVIATPDGHGGYDVTPGDIEFILSGGTLLTRINDASYTYLDPEGPFHMVLKERCNNCSKLHPDSRVPAEQTVTCPEAGEYTVYEGYYALDFPTAAPEACGILLDWAENLEILQDHIEMFPSQKEEGAESDCHDIIESCCELYDQAHYERVDGCFVLKYIDIFVDEDGNAAMEGYLTTLITASDLSEIKHRVDSDINHFKINENYICDKCGIIGDHMPEECESEERGYISCNAELSLYYLEAVVGYGSPPPSGSGDGCYRCELFNASISGFFSDRVICTCDWEQLAAAMTFIVDHCCIPECGSDPSCPGSLDITLSYTNESNVANGLNCGIRRDYTMPGWDPGEEDKFFRQFRTAHPDTECRCDVDPPGAIFPYEDYVEILDLVGRRTSDYLCDYPFTEYSEEPQGATEYANDHCTPDTGFCWHDSPAEYTWVDEITKEEVAAEAESWIGINGETSSHYYVDYGITDRILCGGVVPLEGYLGYDKLETAQGYASRDEHNGHCHIEESVLVFELHGDDRVEVSITLHWTETNYITGLGYSTIERSQVFLPSDFKITLHITAASGATKSVSNFWTSI